jgi:3-oxoacyl-[acyl-carrier-protein] synthase II
VTPIAITGGGCVAPGAGALATEALPVELRERMGRVERLSALALAAGAAALADARVGLGSRRDRAGIVLGTAFGCFLTNADYQERLAAGGVAAASPRLFAATVSNAAAGELGIGLGFAGPGVTLSAGGVSGTVALGHAAALLAVGDADLLLAGGVDARGPSLDAFLAAGGLPVGAPFDEAGALAVLEPLAAARARGAAPRALLVGYGAGFEPEPGAASAGEGALLAVRTALASAATGVDAVAVAASPASGALVDRALSQALGGGVRHLAFAPGVGHSLGAAGPRAVLRVLEAEPSGTTVLIADACASGHVAALVVRVGAPA